MDVRIPVKDVKHEYFAEGTSAASDEQVLCVSHYQ